MGTYEKLYEQVIQAFEESNTAGAGGVFGGGETNSTTFNGGFSGDTLAPKDGRNFFGTYEKPKKKSKNTKKTKKKSKFPWLQKRNLVYN
jgi:hypothetical protein